MGFTETAFNLLDSNRWDDRNRCPVCGNDHDGDCTEEGPDLDAPLCWYCAAPVGEGRLLFVTVRSDGTARE